MLRSRPPIGNQSGESELLFIKIAESEFPVKYAGGCLCAQNSSIRSAFSKPASVETDRCWETQHIYRASGDNVIQ